MCLAEGIKPFWFIFASVLHRFVGFFPGFRFAVDPDLRCRIAVILLALFPDFGHLFFDYFGKFI